MIDDPTEFTATLPESHLSKFPKHAELIGLIINEWNLVEHALIHLLANVLHAERYPVQMMVKSMRASRARLDAIEAGFEAHWGDGGAHEGLSPLIEKARSCLTQRNRYAHAHFYSTNGRHLKIISTQIDEEDEDIERIIPLNELRQTHREIRKLAEEIWRKIADITAVPPWEW